MNVSDDPDNLLKDFAAVVAKFKKTTAENSKDKITVISERPSSYYISNILKFMNVGVYYNDQLRTLCPNDNDLAISLVIRKKRIAWYENLCKILDDVSFGNTG